MANTYKEHRFILDTAHADNLIKATVGNSAGVHFPRILRIKGIRWVAATTATHTAIIQDEDGIVYWESICSGANYVESDLTEREWQKDFKLTALGSGRVYIYLYAGQF